MESYFELQQDNNNLVKFASGPDFYIAPHFHQKMEIFILIEGNYRVARNGQNYDLQSGDIIVFDCYDIHSYEHKKEQVKAIAIIIPPRVAQEFFSRKGGRKIKNPVISDLQLAKRLYQLVFDFAKPKDNCEQIKECAGALVLYLLEQRLEFIENQSKDETALAKNLLMFIDENFKEDISLSSLSKIFSYSPEHLSRVFNRYIKTSLPKYINQLRLDYVETQLLKSPKQNVTSLLFSAGFKSIQTYYRTKNKIKKV